MNDVTIFRKDEFGAVRAVTLEGEPITRICGL